MCVLTYYPLADGGYILTSNRDENVKREKASIPKQMKIGNVQIVAPIDPQSNGTWIATSKKCSVVLLNGGYIKHTPAPPYKQSRGKVIMDFFKINDPIVFFEKYDFENIEPFTFLVFNKMGIYEIKWCSGNKFFKEIKEQKPMIWSSVTLYDNEAIAKRETWYLDYVKAHKESLDQQALVNFNINGGKGDTENSILLNRNNTLKSLSTVQIVFKNTEHSMQYIDHQLNLDRTFRIF